MTRTDSTALVAGAGEDASVGAPASGLLSGLGVFGLDALEPTVIAALVTEEPLLLIGPHGTGKSLLLTRLAEALSLSFRHYNASLLNFDDLLGFPLPQRNGKLEYVQTPASIWGAQAVIFDEINRCRPDMSNRMFPIIHERRAQGIRLHDLRYRWAAMNPPRDDEADDDDPYVGTRPLDAALADRFAFVVRMPHWNEYAEQHQLAIIAADDEPVGCAAAAAFQRVLESVKVRAGGIRRRLDPLICKYVRTLTLLLERARLEISPRRAGMLRRSISATLAADSVLRPDREHADSAFRAVWNGLPHPGLGIRIESSMLRRAHQEAWSLSQDDLAPRMRRILTCLDPVARVSLILAERGFDRAELSSLIRDAMAEAGPGAREAIAFHLFEGGAADRLHAAVAGEAASICANALGAAEVGVAAGNGEWEALQFGSVAWCDIEEALADLKPRDVRAHLAANSVLAAHERNGVPNVRQALAAWLEADRALRRAGGKKR